MRLLITHSHTSERPGYETRKNAKKSNWRKRRHYNKANYRQNLPRTASVAWGGRDEERRIEGECRCYDKGNQRQNPPTGHHRDGGARWKGENQRGMERWHNSQSCEGGKEVPSWKRIANRKQNTWYHASQKKEDKNIQSCATVWVWVDRLPWPPPASELRRASAGRK